MKLVDAVIIGGGIAGLAAAYELERRGATVRVLEAASRPGGVITTARFDGWVIDGGPDSLLVQKPAAVTLCRELGLGDRLVSTLTPRTAYVLRDGQLHPLAEGSFLGFPIRFRALAGSSLFSWQGKLRMASELLIPRRSGGGDESIGAFVRRRFGEEAVDYLAEPLLAGIHAGNVDQLSIGVLFPRLVEAERQGGSVIRSFRALHVTPTAQGAFVSLPGGIGELVDALVAKLHQDTLMLSTRATDVHRAGTYAVHSTAGTIEARALILAVPAYVAAGLLRALDTMLAGHCDAISYASTATVALGYHRDQVQHPLRGTGFVVPLVERNPLLAGTWVTSKWPQRAPEGHVLLRAFLGGGRDPHRLERSDEELVQTAQEGLTEILGITGPPVVARLFRFTRQSPQYEVGHLDRLRDIERQLESIPGLFVTGSGFRSIGIPDCIADGRDTGARAAAFTKM
jgi:protoporphyrinogen/coproporphyrinogen III oxidase